MKVDVKAPDNHSILVIAPFLWGRGDTLKLALKETRKHGSVKEGNFEAWIAPTDVWVNDMGTFYLHHDCKVCQQIVRPIHMKGKRETS